jgi:hypothetical protein
MGARAPRFHSPFSEIALAIKSGMLDILHVRCEMALLLADKNISYEGEIRSILRKM